MVSVNQEIQEVKEEAGKEDIEDLDLVNHKPNHLVDLIAMTISEEPYGLSEEESVVSLISQDPAVESRHMNFVFGDQQLISEDYDVMVEILQFEHPMVQFHIQATSNHQKQQCIPSSWRKRSSEMFKTCKENDDKQENLKFVQWIFEPGRNLWSSGASSIQVGKN